MTKVDTQLAVRLVVLAVVAGFLQIAAIVQLPVFGATADVTPLVAMAVGLLCGAVPAAAVGFALGIVVDVALLQTMGLTSLVLLAVGWWAGRVRELRDPQSPLAPLAMGAAAAAISTVGYGVGQFLLGADSPLSWMLVKQVVSTIVLDALIALPVMAAVRRWLLPALPEDPRRRRRRAYTTGGLSPLQRA